MAKGRLTAFETRRREPFNAEQLSCGQVGPSGRVWLSCLPLACFDGWQFQCMRPILSVPGRVREASTSDTGTKSSVAPRRPSLPLAPASAAPRLARVAESPRFPAHLIDNLEGERMLRRSRQ